MTTQIMMLSLLFTVLQIAIVPNPRSMNCPGGSTKIDVDSPKIIRTIDSSLDTEEYKIDVKDGAVNVVSGSEEGLFRADQTIDQILAQCPEGEVPLMEIKDKPEFAWRGAHFDCCRHFFTIEEVKRFIDIAALHKLNVFHWHLTDDQGWRAEIKAYPRLTQVGAYRGTPHYGSYYTQDDMREIVMYAAQRHITVVPEIEMPGHALAALAAYPEYGCRGEGYAVTEEWGVFEDVFCIGNPKTIEFLKDVLNEICDIFPSQYIHIGGDEAPRKNWKTCPKCQALLKKEGMTSEAELQSYLVREIEAFLSSKGRKLIGWDEILEGGVSRSATVMSWRGPAGGVKAAKLGNDAIMSPYTCCYLDYYQTSNPKKYEPKGTVYHTYLPLRKCYSLNPTDGLDKEQAAHIIGVQANTWCEHIDNFDHVEHMVLPRLAAIAETAWNPDGKTSYDEFVLRMKKAMIPIYEKNGYHYADYAFRKNVVE